MGLEDIENIPSVLADSYNDFIFPNCNNEDIEADFKYDKVFLSNNKNETVSDISVSDEAEPKKFNTIDSFIFPLSKMMGESQCEDFFFQNPVMSNSSSFSFQKEQKNSQNLSSSSKEIFSIIKVKGMPKKPKSLIEMTNHSKSDYRKEKKRNHTKETSDNVNKKIKNQLIKFILDFLTDLVPVYWRGRKMKFRQINSVFITTNQASNKAFFQTSIKDLLKKPISNKYSKPKNQNELNGKSLRNIPEMNALIDMTIGQWFSGLFMRDKEEVLNSFHMRKCKAQFFSDLLRKYEKKESCDYVKTYKKLSQLLLVMH